MARVQLAALTTEKNSGHPSKPVVFRVKLLGLLRMPSQTSKVGRKPKHADVVKLVDTLS